MNHTEDGSAAGAKAVAPGDETLIGRIRSGEAFARLARFCTDHAVATILVTCLLAAAAAGLAAWKLRVDTDPSLMIADHLDFKRKQRDFIGNFPSIADNFLFVVDSDKPEDARAAAARIADELKTRPDLFSHVYAPGTGAFFDDYGILYADTDRVKEIATDVSRAGPMFKALADEPNFAGLSGLMSQITAYAQAGRAPENLTGFLDAASAAVEAENAGKPKPLDWSKLGGEGLELTEKRWFVFAKPILDYSAIDAASGPITEARRVLSDPTVLGDGDVKVRLTGEAALNAEEFEAVTEGAAIAGAISFALVTITVFFGLPVVVLIVPAIALVVLGFLINAGFATLTIGYLNMISVAFAVLFIGLGVDYAVHVILRYAEERGRGLAAADAAVEAVRKMGPALALCTLTTALAFLAFTPTDFVGMAQLGIIAAGGICIAFVASITLIPAILKLLPGDGEKIARKMHKLPVLHGNTDHLTGSRVRMVATFAVIALALAAVTTFPKARFDGDPVNLKDPNAPSVVAFMDIIADNPGETYSVQLLSEPGPAARELAKRIAALPEVREVRSIEDFIPTDQETKLADLKPLADAIPRTVNSGNDIGETLRERMFARFRQDVATLAQTTGMSPALTASARRLDAALNTYEKEKGSDQAATTRLEHNFFTDLPKLLERLNLIATTGPVTVASVEKDLAERYIAPDGRWRLEVIPNGDMRDSAQLRQFVNAVRTSAREATGASVEIFGSAEAVARSMIVATLAALALVVLVVWPVLRRFTDVLLVLAPLVLSASLMIGYTVVAGSPFNFANVIVLPLLLGLGVDSSIHYVMRAREEEVATDVAGTSTPRAVTISALTTIGSFGTLWLSPHRGMASMGELLTIAILVTLVCTLVVLPQLIEWTIGRKPEAKPHTPADGT